MYYSYDDEREDGELTSIDGTLHVWTEGGWCAVGSYDDHMALTGGESIEDIIQTVEDLHEQNIELKENLLCAEDEIGNLEQHIYELEQGFNELFEMHEKPLLDRGWQPILLTPEALTFLKENNQLNIVTATYEDNTVTFIYAEDK